MMPVDPRILERNKLQNQGDHIQVLSAPNMQYNQCPDCSPVYLQRGATQHTARTVHTVANLQQSAARSTTRFSVSQPPVDKTHTRLPIVEWWSWLIPHKTFHHALTNLFIYSSLKSKATPALKIQYMPSKHVILCHQTHHIHCFWPNTTFHMKCFQFSKYSILIIHIQSIHYHTHSFLHSYIRLSDEHLPPHYTWELLHHHT